MLMLCNYMVSCVSKCSCLFAEPQILLEVNRGFGFERCGKSIAMSTRNRCFLQSLLCVGQLSLNFARIWGCFLTPFFAFDLAYAQSRCSPHTSVVLV